MWVFIYEASNIANRQSSMSAEHAIIIIIVNQYAQEKKKQKKKNRMKMVGRSSSY